MFCSKCGIEVNEGVKFCSGCGTQLDSNAPAAPQNQPVYNESTSSDYQSTDKESIFAIICFVISVVSFIIFISVDYLAGFIISLVADLFGYMGLKSAKKYFSYIGLGISIIVFILYMVY